MGNKAPAKKVKRGVKEPRNFQIEKLFRITLEYFRQNKNEACLPDEFTLISSFENKNFLQQRSAINNRRNDFAIFIK